MADPDDELARTATAAPTAVPLPPAARPPDMIGRYRLERELGTGGMGVVYVAFDPDLERRVALKVLRASTSPEAAQRLQREARAMARLNHPNVVTVHEVGTATGRDYVAMELIEGETLAEWLRRQRRTEPQILDAFVQAGRGLAAAHAAGIVHRDFKPHNVLRSHEGRIEVTDFGLARETHAEAISADPLVATLPVGAALDVGRTPSSLAGLTVTGSLLGTPAYMAPEQWTGGTVSPATDQFAFSVALWEALTGERPYAGPTVEELRAQILAGPSALDASRVPRRLRRVLLRGLDPDPRRRWPSMDAMLALLERRGRAGSLLLAGGGALAIAALSITLVLALGNRGEQAPRCAPPALAPSAVWSETQRAALLANGHTAAVAQLDADVKRWTATRELACAAPVEQRTAALACLDGVLGIANAAVRATAKLRDVQQVEIGGVLIDPAVCNTERPPRLLPPTPELADVIEARLREQVSLGPADRARVEALVARVEKEPCAASYAHAMRAGVTDAAVARASLDLLETDGERCTDDRVRADAAVNAVEIASRLEFLGAATTTKLRRAEVAVARVAQADLEADLDVVRMRLAARAENLEASLQRADAAMAGYAARGRIAKMIDVGLFSLSMLQSRASPADLAEIARRIATWRERATRTLGAGHDVLRRIEQVDAWWSFLFGDVAGAHARLAAAARPLPLVDPVVVRGRVVDAAGAPVAGATVVSGMQLLGDAVSVAVPAPQLAAEMRTTTTGADGTYVLSEVPRGGMVIAQLGDRRSMAYEAAPSVELVLRPTSHLEGHVDLRGLPSQRAFIAVRPEGQSFLVRYAIAAPIRGDGTFSLDGAPRGKLRVSTVTAGIMGEGNASITIDASKPSVSGIALVAPVAHRVLHVIVRSTVGMPVPNAQVNVMPGTVTVRNVRELAQADKVMSARLARPLLSESAPAEVRESARADDLYVSMNDAPEGVATACGLALPADLTDPALQAKIEHNLEKLEVRCVPVAPEDRVVTVEVPPWPRLD